MSGAAPAPGRAELSAVQRASRHAIAVAFLFSVFVNLLMLTSPLYMLQVYDRVLASRSESTLVALSLVAAFLFLILGFLDHARARLLARIGARLQGELDSRVLSAAFRRLATHPGDTAALAARHDLDAMARLWSSQVVSALMDLPWAAVFSVALFVFHPLLGAFALGGMIVLAGLAWASRVTGDAAANEVASAVLAGDRLADGLVAESETIRAMGMTGPALTRWQHLREAAQRGAIRAGDRAGSWGSATRALRLFLQSAILGLGAWLVLRGALTAGAMVAASILLGRALLPLEAMITHWPLMRRARVARARLGDLLAAIPPERPRTALPCPRGRIEVAGLAVIPPGERAPVLRGVSFRLMPGQAMGVIGPSGAGKSSLARALCAVWPATAGTLRLDGAALDQYDPDMRGSHIGYLQQRAALFEGTIAENIARLDPAASPARIVAAARKADAHGMITALPEGYDTGVGPGGGRLSGGQIQRIGLARAFYGDPALIVLDEPDSNLDGEGAAALNRAIHAAKAGGAAVIIMSHRPAAIQECELLMVLREGRVRSLGPRDRILREAVRDAATAPAAAMEAGTRARAGARP